MNIANLDTFLDALLFDSEDSGTPVPDRPGYVQYFETPFEKDDLVLRQYTDEESRSGLAVMDSDNHGSAYGAAMLAALHLRRYWRQTGEWFLEKSVEESLESMVEDVQHVIENLTILRSALQKLQVGKQALDRELSGRREICGKAKLSLAEANNAAVQAETKLKSSIRALDLFQTLSEGPVEQLARVGQDNDNTQEGA